ncbi:hypothetical protein [Umezawaea sp. Da 62-37]|uniref:hypothetical protein n=1 Tax=Umezawaea sp. Da 62-37 TaxID=3075927 RepID=UPI0028F7302F|nr:hypothetical protein [Umezawaea sp. Da 62-37]WNV82232.1 hypothetical protein RM788_28940 [Umezawaea sp. Da 62-37]
MTEPVTPARDGQELHGEFLLLKMHGCRSLRLRGGVGEYITTDHGDTVDYDDLRTTQWTADLVELPVRYSDTAGSELDVVNQQHLIEEFGAQVFVHLHNDRDGAHGLALPVCQPLPGDDAEHSALCRLVEMVGRLRDYPLLDEDRHSRYIDDRAEEAWRSHLRRDVIKALRDLSPDAEADRAVTTAGLDAADPIGAAYFGFEGNEWTAVTLSQVRNGRHDQAVLHVAVILFGWEV